jgi:hypothetical protein
MARPEQTRFTPEPQNVSNAGDLSSMLQLSGADELRKPEGVMIQKVSPSQNRRSTRGFGNEAESTSPEMLMGDSFTNIYSAGELQWGTSAGFAEQLSVELQLAVDSLAVNGGGAPEFASVIRVLDRPRCVAPGYLYDQGAACVRRGLSAGIAVVLLSEERWKLATVGVSMGAGTWDSARVSRL